METIEFDFENCFGIKKLHATIELKNDKSIAIIYAPNGTMKTSFAKTCNALASNESTDIKGGRKKILEQEKVCDRLHPELQSKYVINADGKPINASSIFVANPDVEFDASKKISTFLASKDLKEEYESIVNSLERSKMDFIKALKVQSKSTDCESELIKAFKNDEKSSFFECIEIIDSILQNNEYSLYDFKYNNIFDKRGSVKSFLDENKEILNEYVVQYNRLISESSFFHSSNGKTFGTYQASQLANSVKGGEFFSVGHKLLLNNEEEIDSQENYNAKIESEKTRIFSNEQLKSTFETLSKLLDANAELRDFQIEITKHPEWVANLTNYEDFRKSVLLGYISSESVRPKFEELKNIYTEKKEELIEISTKANAEQEKWKEIIGIFNARFSVPFTARIENQQNVLLKSEDPQLIFDYKDGNNGVSSQNTESILKILSKGERRAFFILHFLFEIENRKELSDENLIIMDDISDSFDYQNKYAIIEYVKDIVTDNDSKFKIILLTHNFDFYRTLASRVSGKCKQLMVKKDINHSITLKDGVYIKKTPFEIEIKDSNDDLKFISMIPFLRNMMEYMRGTSSDEYKKLTSCLHLKPDTDNIIDSDISNIAKQLQGCNYNRNDKEYKFIDILNREVSELIKKEQSESLMIENKIVLSIAIRLKTEEFLKKELLTIGETEESLNVSNDQTSAWLKKYKSTNPPYETLVILERVNMMTPEFIHINSFMYEPLVDMSEYQLKKLYIEVSGLFNS